MVKHLHYLLNILQDEFHEVFSIPHDTKVGHKNYIEFDAYSWSLRLLPSGCFIEIALNLENVHYLPRIDVPVDALYESKRLQLYIDCLRDILEHYTVEIKRPLGVLKESKPGVMCEFCYQAILIETPKGALCPSCGTKYSTLEWQRNQ